MTPLTRRQVEGWVRQVRAVYLSRGAEPESADRLADAFRVVADAYRSRRSRAAQRGTRRGRLSGADNPSNRPRCRGAAIYRDGDAKGESVGGGE